MMKKIIVMLVLTAMTVLSMPCTNAAIPYDSYTYSTQTGEPIPVYCPTPYYPAQSIDKASLGVPLMTPVDICFDKEKRVYIVDSSANCIFVLNPDYSFNRKIEDFTNDEGMFDFFSAPNGIAVNKNGDIYVCDTGNKRIVIFDKDFKVKTIWQNIVPVGATEDDDYVFSPLKIAVDDGGNANVLIKNDYQGILLIDSNGNFVSYLGSNKVTFDPITRLWKKLMSKQQREQMEQFLPIEYTNISLDKSGLINAVSKGGKTDPIKRLNLAGNDVMIRNGYVDVAGDIFNDPKGEESSTFVDIVSDENGLTYVLDSYKGRIFVYNTEGFLLYVFGTLGNQFGSFSIPSAIEINGSDILVADSGSSRITVFKQTAYGELISQADKAYSEGRYDDSIEKWSQVIERNSNFELAYTQIGKVYSRRDQPKEAMEYFKLGNYRGDKVTNTTGFNKAFSEYRRDIAAKLMGPIVIVVLLIILVVYLISRFKKKGVKNREK